MAYNFRARLRCQEKANDRLWNWNIRLYDENEFNKGELERIKRKCLMIAEKAKKEVPEFHKKYFEPLHLERVQIENEGETPQPGDHLNTPQWESFLTDMYNDSQPKDSEDEGPLYDGTIGEKIKQLNSN